MKPVNFMDDHGNPHWRMVPDENETQHILSELANESQRLGLYDTDGTIVYQNPGQDSSPGPDMEYPTQSRYAESRAPEKLTQEEIEHIPNLPEHHVSAVAFLMAEAREIAKGGELGNETKALFGSVVDQLKVRLNGAIVTAQKNDQTLREWLPEIIRSATLLHISLQEKLDVTSYAKVAQSAPVIPMKPGPSIKDIEDLKRSIEEPLKKAAKSFADRIGPKQANGATE